MTSRSRDVSFHDHQGKADETGWRSSCVAARGAGARGQECRWSVSWMV